MHGECLHQEIQQGSGIRPNKTPVCWLTSTGHWWELPQKVVTFQKSPICNFYFDNVIMSLNSPNFSFDSFKIGGQYLNFEVIFKLRHKKFKRSAQFHTCGKNLFTVIQCSKTMCIREWQFRRKFHSTADTDFSICVLLSQLFRWYQAHSAFQSTPTCDIALLVTSNCTSPAEEAMHGRLGVYISWLLLGITCLVQS
jgi:hypothetical protein